MDTQKLILTKPSDTETVMTRTFDFPRDLVWRAMTDPVHVAKWWGPRGMTTVVEKMDVRPGGKWRYVQEDGKGNTYAFFGEYREVEAPKRVVSTFEFEPMPGHVIVETMTLEELPGGKTKYANHSLYQSKEDLDGMIASGMEGGANDSMQRLSELLETL